MTEKNSPALTGDARPANCRNVLRDEGKPYPKSGCASCGNGGLMGCPHERAAAPASTGEHEIGLMAQAMADASICAGAWNEMNEHGRAVWVHRARAGYAALAALPASSTPATTGEGEVWRLKADLKDEINFDLNTRVNKVPESVVDQVVDLLAERGVLTIAALPPSSTTEPESGTVLQEVGAERRRQVEVEGWTAEHDDEHAPNDLLRAAIAYAWAQADSGSGLQASYAQYAVWPWEASWWKPKDRRSDLIRATALLVAEIERMDRASAALPPPPSSEGAGA